MKPVDYDEVSKTYDGRYRSGSVKGIEDAVRDLALIVKAKSALEVGCGTGAYLDLFKTSVSSYGLDSSAGMLAKAKERACSAALVRGTALCIPFSSSVFDLVTCIHALHHFDDKPSFVREVKRILRPGGALGVINMDPHKGQDKWYAYEYFPETYEMDLKRYPSGPRVIGWMSQAGFVRCETRPIHRFLFHYRGREIFDDPVFHRQGSSQYSLLSDRQWEEGVGRMMKAIEEAEAKGKDVVFEMDVAIYMSIGYTE